MGAGRLLWSCLWRSTLLNVASGCVLGTIYGATVPVLAFWLSIAIQYGEVSGPASDGGGAFLLVAGFGSLAGLSLGGLYGVILGVLHGILVACITRARYYPRPADAGRYARTAAVACAATSVVVVVGLWIASGPGENGTAAAVAPFGHLELDFLISALVPALVAGGIGIWSGRVIARWWVRRTVT